jgi:hypothetical protein
LDRAANGSGPRTGMRQLDPISHSVISPGAWQRRVLYHLLMPVEGGGKATPASYSVPGHVVEEVIDDIAKWVKHKEK